MTTDIERAQEAEERERLRQSIADYRGGRARDARDVLASLDAKHLVKDGATNKRRTTR
jgi:hypothetical protein